MDGITIYPTFCEQFERLAQDFYSQYRFAIEHTDTSEACDFFKSPKSFAQQMTLDNLRETAAICAIVFEALAIESYVNFWGASILGDAVFFSKYEPQKGATSSETIKPHYRSTLDKMKAICKEEFGNPYPTDGIHYSTLKGLFQKRDRLVHNKPKGHLLELAPFNYDSPEAAYKDYVEVFEEIGFIYEKIDDELRLYEEVKANLKSCSGKPDASEQQFLKSIEQIAKQMSAMVNAVGLELNEKE